MAPKHSDAYIENEGLVKQTSREATAQAKVIKEL